MSGLSGSPQQDSRDSEGVQPRTPENQQQREFLHHISVSPSSLVTPRQTLSGEGLQPDTPTPNPNHPSNHGEGVQGQVTEPEDVQMANQGWDIAPDPNPKAWSFGDNEGLRGHVTANTSSSETQDSSTGVPMQITSSTPHLTPVVQPTQTGTMQPPSTPKNTVPVPRQMIPLPYQEGQTILGRDKRGGGESPLAYVSLGSGSDSASSPNYDNPPSKRSRLVQKDDMDIETHGYQSGESPNTVPPIPNASSSSSNSPPTLTYAQKAKGKHKETSYAAMAGQKKSNTPLLNRTWCKLKEFPDTRTPPVTDVLYSVWMNLVDVYEDQAAIYAFAAKNPNIGGLSYRPTNQWTEFYCKSLTQVENLLKQEWTVGTTRCWFIPAKKLAGSRIFLKLANVTPCHSEKETREAIAKILSPYGTAGDIEPHYIVDPTGEFPDDLLCTRRWDAELFVPEGYRLIMDSTPTILENTTIVYWKGQYPVCLFCQVTGHWAKDCNSALRAKAQAAKISKIPPVPFTAPVVTPPETTPPAASQPETTPNQPTTKKTPQKGAQPEATASKKTPQPTQAPQTQAPPKTVPQTKTTTIVKERDIIQQSREVNATTGGAMDVDTIVIRDDEGEWQPVRTRKQRRASTAEKRKGKDKETEASGSGTSTEDGRKKAKPTPNLPLTAIQTSNRPRTVGNQLQYYLFLMSRGQILTSELQGYINKADPVAFITTTKPAMKQREYEAFTNWVSKRKRANKDDMQDVARWKVSIPDHMNPNNASYVDTTISAKRYNELEEQRLNKPGKLTVWLAEGASSDLATSEVITFKPKDKMSTLARVMKKKLKLNYLIKIRLTDTDQNLSITGTADQAGLKDGMTLFVSRAETESSEESTDETITIKIQRNDSSKVWTVNLPASASTTHLYHEFTQTTHQQHGHFTLYRSNGLRVSRFTTIGNLHLRKGEVLTYSAHTPVAVQVNWLDSVQKEKQQKQTFVNEEVTVDDLIDILTQEFELDFQFEILMDNAYGSQAIKYYTNNANILVIYLARIGLNWDDKNFTPTQPLKEVMTITTGFSEIRTITMEVFPGSTIADFAQLVYTQSPETQSKVLEDRLGLPYELTDMLEHIVPVNGVLSIRINVVQEYTAEQASLAITTIAALRAVSTDTLAADSLSSLPK